jgi:hypothetical protein
MIINLRNINSGHVEKNDYKSYLNGTFVYILLVCINPIFTQGWGGEDDSESQQAAIFGNGLSRDWLYNSNAISLQLEGCVWGYVADHDNADCMENGSQDGTTYWYQMANCRRAQAVYRMYATSSGNSASCNSQNFKESVSTESIDCFI